MDFQQFIGLVQNGGAAMGVVFAALYWIERGDRKGKDKENVVLLERAITALESTKNAVDRLALILGVNGHDS